MKNRHLIGKLLCMPKKIASKQPRQKHFIREWVEFRGLSQERLAEMLETTPQSVSRILAGIQPYTQDSLEAIAYLLNVAPGDLISRSPFDDVEGWSLLDLADEDQIVVRALIRSLKEKRSPSGRSSLQPPQKRVNAS